jgi:hypothetical protein
MKTEERKDIEITKEQWKQMELFGKKLEQEGDIISEEEMEWLTYEELKYIESNYDGFASRTFAKYNIGHKDFEKALEFITTDYDRILDELKAVIREDFDMTKGNKISVKELININPKEFYHIDWEEGEEGYYQGFEIFGDYEQIEALWEKYHYYCIGNEVLEEILSRGPKAFEFIGEDEEGITFESDNIIITFIVKEGELTGVSINSDSNRLYDNEEICKKIWREFALSNHELRVKYLASIV